MKYTSSSQVRQHPYITLAVFVALLGMSLLGWETFAQRRLAPQKGSTSVQSKPEAILADGDFDPSFTTTDRPGTVPAGVSRIQFPFGAPDSGAGSDQGSESPAFVGQQSDGKIVVVMQVSYSSPPPAFNGIALVRLNTNGTIDTSFGGAPGGKVQIPVQSPAGPSGNNHRNPRAFKAVMFGDKIVILGSVDFGTADGGSPSNICQSGMFQANDHLVVMVNADGTLDTNFDGDPAVPGNGNGQVRIPIGTCTDGPSGISVQSDGKIVVSGTAQDVGPFNAMDNSNQQNVTYAVFFRLNTDGTLDTTYDTETAHDGTNDGIAKHRISSSGLPALPLDTSFPNNEIAGSDIQVIQSGPHANKAILVGYGDHSGHGDFRLNRIDTGGQVDMTFASGAGFVKTHIGDAGQTSSSVQAMMYKDGTNRVLVGGTATADPPPAGGTFPSETRLAIARYSVDGALDTSAHHGEFVVTAGQPCNNLSVVRPIFGIDNLGRIAMGAGMNCPDAAYSGGFGSALDIGIIRLTTALALDGGFATGGRLVTHLDTSGGGTDFALQAPIGGMEAFGKILVSGTANVAGQGQADAYVLRLRNATQTASSSSVSGRVVAEGGRGLTNARVVITGPDGSSQIAVTGRNGMFNFTAVESGRTYIISIGSRRYTYSPQTVQVNDNVSGLVFSPE